MENSLQQFAAEHRQLIDAAAREAGFTAPVAVTLGDFYWPLMRAARKGPMLPIDSVLVRHWSTYKPRKGPGLWLGMRLFEIEGIRFVTISFGYDKNQHCSGFDFTIVERRDYRRLFRIALRCYRELDEEASPPPVLSAPQREVLWRNKIGFLDTANLRRYQIYGVRARRGILLLGPPGNGKTMACRWIMDHCQERGWEWKLVTPDSYRQARSNNSIDEQFSVGTRGIIFFDDMDLALRDRETVHETEDQAVFLSALDGIEVHEGVVFVFTSNCAPELIDRAFKRPGRLDAVLHFELPDAALRRQLVARWHEDIRKNVNVESVIASTDGRSFAEIEELKNLLVMGFLEKSVWDWDGALQQFEINRCELNARKERRVGFGQREPIGNGAGNGH